MDGIENGLNSFEYVFEPHVLTPIDRRDTEVERAEARERTSEPMEQLESEIDDAEHYGGASFHEWTEEFGESPYFEALTDSQKEDAFFIIDSFHNYSINYVGLCFAWAGLMLGTRHPVSWSSFSQSPYSRRSPRWRQAYPPIT